MSGPKEVRSAMPEKTSLPPALDALLRRGMPPHAVLLEGADRAGLRAAALEFAGALLCREGKGRMCGKCPSCRRVLDLCHSDVIIVDKTADPDAFRKENVRALRAAAFEKPVEGDRRVCLFLDAGGLTPEVQNLLLNITEEPPEGVFFALTAANRYRLLPTVLSRFTCFALPEPDDAAALAALSAGLTPAQAETARALAEAAAGRDSYRVLCLLAPLEKKRDAYLQVLEAAMELSMNTAAFPEAPPRARLRVRELFPPLLALCDANAHLPLVSALLAERCRSLPAADMKGSTIYG